MRLRRRSTSAPAAARLASEWIVRTIEDLVLSDKRELSEFAVLYRTNADAIKPLHDWTSTFQQLWKQQLSRVKARAEAK